MSKECPSCRETIDPVKGKYFDEIYPGVCPRCGSSL
jgi:hypothetical protein